MRVDLRKDQISASSLSITMLVSFVLVATIKVCMEHINAVGSDCILGCKTQMRQAIYLAICDSSGPEGFVVSYTIPLTVRSIAEIRELI